MFNSNEGITSRADADQFIELDLDRGAVAVLGVLNQEHHQECHNRGARIDDKLPSIGIAEQRPCNGPNYHHAGSNDERRGVARSLRRPVGHIPKHFGEPCRLLLALLRFSRETCKDCLIVFSVRPTIPPPLRPIRSVDVISGSQHLSTSTAVVSLSSVVDRNPAGRPASLAAA